jgi:rsbT co-antagonist protein RsbR
MWNSIRQWLAQLKINDPVERQQALILQLVLLGQMLLGMIGLPINLLTNLEPTARIITVSAYTFVILLTVGTLILLRRGRLQASVYVYGIGMILMLGAALAPNGLRGAGYSTMVMMLPIILAGVLLDRRGLLVMIGLSLSVLVLLAAGEHAAPAMVGSVPAQGNPTTSIILVFVLTSSLAGVFLERFGGALREALHASRQREHDLEQLRASLETMVAERTTELRSALETVAQREANLNRTLAELQASEATVRELSAPVIPVLPGVLVAPVVGILDQARAQQLTEKVLQAIEENNAHHLMLDVTGVHALDVDAAHSILRTADAVRLLGAQVLLVGVRPDSAQTLVGLGIDLSALTPRLNLEEAVTSILRTRPQLSGHERRTSNNAQAGR